MSEYIVFTGDREPSGGMNDYEDSFDNAKKAVEFTEKIILNDDVEWVQIYIKSTMKEWASLYDWGLNGRIWTKDFQDIDIELAINKDSK